MTSPHRAPSDRVPASERTDWPAVLRVATLVSIAAGLSAYLLVSAGLQEQSVVLAVIVIVSWLAWSGVFDRHPPATLLRIRATTATTRSIDPMIHSPGELHDTMHPWEDHRRAS